MSRGEIAVPHDFGPKDLPIFQRRLMHCIDRWQRNSFILRHNLQFRREPPNTKNLLEQSINSIKRSPGLAAGNDEPITIRAENESIRPALGKIRLLSQLAQMRIVAQKDLP